ncbi:alpha/beta fold hydrolase [Arthrobacter sp. JZ12]|uniref:alpha/beta fold hydrolase n=1 Tax=Arthrobacter sp. JZ12 TaxID=2654190 RepID=UPI002B4797DB|nr:alpha/beta fold hydrolase [Arthrobacter sp. JZ12]WRH26448.1 alpha/beta fold hydrolase [Arthrobacter sp. JZ12]
MRGLRCTAHYFSVPLDHTDPDGERIELFAREYSSLEHDDGAAARLPWLLFLQGGPGIRGNRVTQLSGWMKAAARRFRILMLDQRGTGLSTPADALSLASRGTPQDQARYLRHFRADSIVADAEAVREALGSGPWTVFGQSFGGFCTLTYLSFAPEGIERALITGGLAPISGSPERVYRKTFERVAARNREYFARYPEDRAAVTRIARHLEKVAEILPTGERLTPQRFQMVGSYLGGNTRIDSLHYLLEDAFAPSGDRLSPVFLDQLQPVISRRSNPLYALLHESIYCQGEASRWSAWRVLPEFPKFLPDAPEPLLTGEMVYPWYFDEDPALVPLRETADILADVDDWGPLYSRAQLARNAVPVAAAVYRDDIYVDRDLSLETAAQVQGLQVWETPEFHHDGISDDGDAIFSRLLAMTEA